MYSVARQLFASCVHRALESCAMRTYPPSTSDCGTHHVPLIHAHCCVCPFLVACSITDPAAAAGQATVSDQLSDLVKQAQLATSRTLLDWLRLLTQIQVQEQQRQQRQQHLRAVVDLRAQLQVGTADSSSTCCATCRITNRLGPYEHLPCIFQPVAAGFANL